jgi:hypothetical protein
MTKVEKRWVCQSVHFDTRTDEPECGRLRTVADLATLGDGEFVASTDLIEGVECGYFSEDQANQATSWLSDRGVSPEDAAAMVAESLKFRGHRIRIVDGKILK